MVHKKANKENNADLECRIATQLKRMDIAVSGMQLLNVELEKALSLEQEEEKFVSKGELLLHMKNLELKAENTNSNIDKIEKHVEKLDGKLEDIISILSEKMK